ncbi:MAG: hypothetical protein IJ758_02480 [Clostridia bacterium]|nr:hypothetical protein [Clostridia bacterium]
MKNFQKQLAARGKLFFIEGRGHYNARCESIRARINQEFFTQDEVIGGLATLTMFFLL